MNGTAKQAERYPLPLVRKVLKAIRDGLRRCRGSSISAVEVGLHIDEDPPEPKFSFDHLNDSKIYDQYTGVELDVQKVGEARKEELEFADKLNAWTVRPRQEAYDKMGLQQLASQTQQVIDANKDKQFADVKKPEESDLIQPVKK